jgi:D-galactarolactone cycloisomerase
MKISNIETFILRVPLGKQRFISSQAEFPERNSLLVKITTDEGVVGWGEGGQYGPPEPVASCIRDVFSPLLVGRAIVHPAKIWEELYAFSRDFGRKGAYIEAISAADIALWDIWGKTLNQPIYSLLGGPFRDRVTAYATGCYYGENYSDQKEVLRDLAKEAKSYPASGFGMLKMKVGLLPIKLDMERVAVVREAIGPEIKLLVDCNHAYNASSAIRMGRELERQGVLWYEEPVLPEDHAAYRRVRDALHIPIAGGECEFTRYGFLELFQHQCIDIAQPDICVCGGFSEWTRIQSLALSFGVLTVPHVWGSGVALSVALHALATVPLTPHTANPVPLQNEPVIEFDQKPNPLRDDLLVEQFALEEGAVRVPIGPGLGVTVNEEIVDRYSQKSSETGTVKNFTSSARKPLARRANNKTPNKTERKKTNVIA